MLQWRNLSAEQRSWCVWHGDLRIGPLGGYGGDCRCVSCNAPLFDDETDTKCCLFRKGDRAGWYGPFCTYPYIPRPDGQYSALWYEDTDDAKYFRANTRLYNSRYAFSSLQAHRVKLAGKPVFKLKGQVYYRLAPTMEPPADRETGLPQPLDYAQLYTLDEQAGFDERLERLLAARRRVGAGSDSEASSDGDGTDGEPLQMPVGERRLRAVLGVVHPTMHRNPLAQQYKAAFDAADRDVPTACLRLLTDPGKLPPGGAAAGAHERQYNAPHADNVAVLLHTPAAGAKLDLLVQRKDAAQFSAASVRVHVDSQGRASKVKVAWLTSQPAQGMYDVVDVGDGCIGAPVRLRGGAAFANPPAALKRVNYSHALYDTLAFPLYFHRGTPTWHHNFKVPSFGGRWVKVQLQQFYASMLYVRRGIRDMPCAGQSGVRRVVEVSEGSPGASRDGSAWRAANDNLWFFRGGRLFQQFVCTASARCELKRLDTLASPAMQQQLRADTYQSLVDAIGDGHEPGDVGRRVICPDSVKGSRRAMYKLFLNCMAIVRKHGSPHLFITVRTQGGAPRESLL